MFGPAVRICRRRISPLFFPVRRLRSVRVLTALPSVKTRLRRHTFTTDDLLFIGFLLSSIDTLTVVPMVGFKNKPKKKHAHA